MEEFYGEIKLMGRVAGGDEEAFRLLYNRYWPKVYQKARHLLKSDDLAQDLTQEAFVRIWEKRERLSTVENFEGYLFTLVRNLFIDTLRKKITAEVAIETIDLPRRMVPADDNDAHKRMEYRELEQLLNRAIENLPGQMQTAFRLSRFEGLTHRQIGLEMNITKVTSQNYLARALLQIRNYMTDRSDEHLS